MEAEVKGYLTELNILRGQIREAIKGLNDEAANWTPLTKDTNSIYAILNHLIGAETFWIKHMVAGEVVDRDREAEFHSSGNLIELIDRWEDLTETCDSILDKLRSSQLGEPRTVDNRPEWGKITVRWCILHQISHYALHLGHIQLTKQLWEQK